MPTRAEIMLLRTQCRVEIYPKNPKGENKNWHLKLIHKPTGTEIEAWDRLPRREVKEALLAKLYEKLPTKH